ncbi:MAG: hypothetical protein JWQ42_2588 [Edaphobacter sp.]|nr:hypothetical protein [Edaphobacter sp.]
MRGGHPVPLGRLHDHRHLHPLQRLRQRRPPDPRHQLLQRQPHHHLHHPAQRPLHRRGHCPPDHPQPGQLRPHPNRRHRPHPPVHHQQPHGTVPQSHPRTPAPVRPHESTLHQPRTQRRLRPQRRLPPPHQRRHHRNPLRPGHPHRRRLNLQRDRLRRGLRHRHRLPQHHRQPLPPGILNFNQVTSGQTASQTLTLTNTGTSPVTVRRITSGWPFLSTTTCRATLASNQSCTATIAYTPLNQLATGTTSPLPSTDAGSLVIESDAASSPDIIDLTGTAAPILVASPSNTAPLVSFTASQGSLTFAPTKVGNASAPQTVTLTNTGTGTATIHINGVQTTSDFTVVNACTTIVPGASCTLTASFTPQAAGTRIGALEIASDSSTSLDFISLLGTASPSALIFSPTSLDFGTLLVGATGRLPIQITNSSPTPATFNGISTTGDYAVTGTCPTPGGTLAPSTSCTLQLSFTPTQPGTRPGTVSLSTSLSTLPLTAQLTGIGAQSHLQISPASLSFGSIAIGATAVRTLTLANTGTAPINTVALSITGDYAITIPCALTSLAPGASCSVTITFTPRAIGPRAGALTVASTDQSSPTTVPLTGTGIADGTFALTVDGGTTSTVTVKSGNPATYNLTLTPGNTFSGAVVLNCTPIKPGQYATCSLLPSSVTLNGAAQNATATINTITSVSTAANKSGIDATILCILPTALLFFWRLRQPHKGRPHAVLWTTLLFTAAALFASGCGSGVAPIINSKDPNLRYTPPGAYQYQITASSTTGVQITQTVTLNLIVTAQ